MNLSTSFDRYKNKPSHNEQSANVSCSTTSIIPTLTMSLFHTLVATKITEQLNNSAVQTVQQNNNNNNNNIRIIIGSQSVNAK